MEKQDAFVCGMNMIYLAACALHGKAPSRHVVDCMDLAGVHHQAVRHSMNVITYEALSLFVAQHGREALAIDEDLWRQWGAERVNAIRRIIGFEMERERLQAFLEQNNIWHMPLKGLILQAYYPKIGMRQMCDNDILFDPAYRKDVRDFMKENGYKAKQYGTPYPDEYLKSPFNFEMHHQIFFEVSVKDYARFNRYYRHIKDRLLPDDGCRMRFRDEDFYIYSIVHSYKHYVVGGNGIRSLMDVFVYLGAVGDRLEHAYIQRELESLGVADYHACVVKLASMLFAPTLPEPNALIAGMDDAMRNTVAFMIDSGTYGTRRHLIEGELKSSTDPSRIGFWKKTKYVMRRVFPNTEFYYLHFPVTQRHKTLIPLCWGYRFLRAAFRRPGRMFAEWITVLKAK